MLVLLSICLGSWSPATTSQVSMLDQLDEEVTSDSLYVWLW